MRFGFAPFSVRAEKKHVKLESGRKTHIIYEINLTVLGGNEVGKTENAINGRDLPVHTHTPSRNTVTHLGKHKDAFEREKSLMEHVIREYHVCCRDRGKYAFNVSLIIAEKAREMWPIVSRKFIVYYIMCVYWRAKIFVS